MVLLSLLPGVPFSKSVSTLILGWQAVGEGCTMPAQTLQGLEAE